jgi:hypothetical protein
MAAFDRLPATIRAALAASAWNFVPQPILSWWRRAPGFGTEAEILHLLAVWETEYTSKQALKTYGADHPQAAGARRLKTNRKKKGL